MMKVLVCLVALQLVFALPAHACKCPMRFPAQAEEYAAQARAVFLGRVVSADYTEKKAVFTAEKAWKGIDPASSKVVLKLDFKADKCGWYAFRKGGRYLVFTAKNSLSLTHCSPTRNADKDRAIKMYFKALGKPETVFGK